jgi:hypothetical protein
VSLKYVLNCKQHFSYFYLDYPTSRLTVTGLARVYSLHTFQYSTSDNNCKIVIIYNYFFCLKAKKFFSKSLYRFHWYQNYIKTYNT